MLYVDERKLLLLLLSKIMNLTPLKYLLVIENILCLFRNYFCLKRCSRIVVGFWAFFELLVVSIDIVSYVVHNTELKLDAQSIYFFSISGFSIYIMIVSLYYAKTFYQLLCNFDAFQSIFADVDFACIMWKAQKRLTIMIVTFSCVQVLVFTYFRLVYSDKANTRFITQTLAVYSASVSDFRYTYQYFTLNCILFVISEQLQVITRSMEKGMSLLRATEGNMEHEDDGLSVAVDQDRLKKIDKWMKAYKNINDSSNLCNTMYSVQLSIMILIGTTYCIILLYSIAIITVEGVPSPLTLFSNMWSMMKFLMLLNIVSRSGQRVQNHSDKLRQKLCELCIHSLGDEQYYKLSKDLLRCVRTRPVRLHVFGSLDLNVAILPSIVAFFTSYTVIALQFNNVL